MAEGNFKGVRPYSWSVVAPQYISLYESSAVASLFHPQIGWLNTRSESLFLIVAGEVSDHAIMPDRRFSALLLA